MRASASVLSITCSNAITPLTMALDGQMIMYVYIYCECPHTNFTNFAKLKLKPPIFLSHSLALFHFIAVANQIAEEGEKNNKMIATANDLSFLQTVK